VDLERLTAWQLHHLRQTLARAAQHSSFYADRLCDVRPESLRAPDDIARLPFTSAGDLVAAGERMLCVPPSEIDRIVTLPTSGTTGAPKRVFFTAADLELTVDFFLHGMATFTEAGDTVLVFMPGERPGSVGDLLRRALARLGARAVVHGPVTDVDAALDALRTEHPAVLVGLPVQLLTLARAQAAGGGARPSVRAVLASADRTVPAVRCAIEEAWRCTVFDHYGTTEMGFGGGVECEAHAGYHLREADLLFEVVSPESGLPVPPGETGEVVVTTLTRAGMPLIRYRTGDLATWSQVACRCGSSLPLLGHIQGRVEGAVHLAGGSALSVGLLDDLLLALPEVADYQAVVADAGEPGEGELLRVTVRLSGAAKEGAAAQDVAAPQDVVAAARRALEAPGSGLRGVADGSLRVEVAAADGSTWPVSSGMLKRTIDDQRGTVTDA